MARHEDRVPWWVVARRLVPFALIQVLLAICWVLMIIGYGKKEADAFYEGAFWR